MIGCAIIVGSGVLYMVLGRPYARGTSPSGDAVKARLNSTRRLEVGHEGAERLRAGGLVPLAQDRARVDRDEHHGREVGLQRLAAVLGHA